MEGACEWLESCFVSCAALFYAAVVYSFRASLSATLFHSKTDLLLPIYCFRSEDWYKDHPNFKVLYHDADGDGKKDFGDRRIFDQVNVNRKRE
jgi:hypothetical protein